MVPRSRWMAGCGSDRREPAIDAAVFGTGTVEPLTFRSAGCGEPGVGQAFVIKLARGETGSG